MTLATQAAFDPAPLEALERLGPPPTDADGLLEVIRNHNVSRRIWTVVLDDDPTGTQTVANVPVITANWTEEQLRWASADDSGVAFVLTNSRSLDSADAFRLVYEITKLAGHLARTEGRQLRLITRSDSTLRGHFAAELKAARSALVECGYQVSGTVFVPSFLEAGRFTAQNIQWVGLRDALVPAALTEFARDKAFGYTELSLNDWICRQLGKDIRRLDAVALSELRHGDPVSAVEQHLTGLGPNDVLLANAVRAHDLEVLMAGLARSEQQGRLHLVRSGPSFVRICAGQPVHEPITCAPRSDSTTGRGLVVVGSHTHLTNDQMAVALRDHDLATVDLDVHAILKPPIDAEAEIARCVSAVLGLLRHRDVVLRTSRELVPGPVEDPLETSRHVSDALCTAVRQIAEAVRPAFIIAKGGITSSDIATRGLGATRARVDGQMEVGKIALWSLDDGALPGVPYVVFPGNAGDQSALSRAIESLGSQVA